jgi:hypothetical protein
MPARQLEGIRPDYVQLLQIIAGGNPGIVVRQESHVGFLWRGISCGGQYSPLGHGI